MGRGGGRAGEGGHSVVSIALGELFVGQGHEGVEASGRSGGRGGVGFRVGCAIRVHRFGFGDLADVHQAEACGHVGFGEGLAADAALGLKFAQRVDAAVHDVDRLRACAVHGFLLRGGCGVLHRVEDGDLGDVLFDHAAAAESPGGAHDFSSEGLFHGSGGGEFGPEIGTDFGVGFGFVFADVVGDGEEAEGEAVL